MKSAMIRTSWKSSFDSRRMLFRPDGEIFFESEDIITIPSDSEIKLEHSAVDLLTNLLSKRKFNKGILYKSMSWIFPGVEIKLVEK